MGVLIQPLHFTEEPAVGNEVNFHSLLISRPTQNRELQFPGTKHVHIAWEGPEGQGFLSQTTCNLTHLTQQLSVRP